MINPIKNVFNLFYTNSCLVCKSSIVNHDALICVSCKMDLPFTAYSNWRDNEIEKSFYGRVSIEAATSLLYFKQKGIVQKMMHQLKYKNEQRIGTVLGCWLAEKMVLSGRFDTVDYVIPVPLHKIKMKKRGYNQLTKFGEVLSQKLNIPFINDVLIRVKESETQTFKNRIDRGGVIDEKFQLLDKKRLEGKHVLLIDDIITTGVTLEACCIQLLKTNQLKISIATMAFTL